MVQYASVLKQLYPQGHQFDALLPRTNSRRDMNLSQYGLDNLGFIGEGALSTVYKVRDRRDGKEYACKVTSMKHHNADCPPWFAAQKTLQEIRLLKKLLADNVCGIMPLCSFLPSEQAINEYISRTRNLPAVLAGDLLILQLMPLGIPYSVFIEGLFRSGRKLSNKDVAALMLDLVLPIKYMHNKSSIIHRDIKVDNYILIRSSNGKTRTALSDFNISKEFVGGYDYNYSHVGTPRYINPSIDAKAASKQPVKRSDAEKGDLYAVAQIIYGMLNKGVMAPNRGTIPEPKDSPSAEVTELLRAMLNPDASRIPSCEVVISRLKALLNNHKTIRATQKPAMVASAHTKMYPQVNSRPVKRKNTPSTKVKKSQNNIRANNGFPKFFG